MWKTLLREGTDYAINCQLILQYNTENYNLMCQVVDISLKYQVNNFAGAKYYYLQL